MPLIGYARVSTDDQTLLPQAQALKAAGCSVIREQHGSGGNRARPVLTSVLDGIRNGDTLEGGAGRDTITRGAGDDLIYLGEGRGRDGDADTVVFRVDMVAICWTMAAGTTTSRRPGKGCCIRWETTRSC